MKGTPVVWQLPSEVWINKPTSSAQEFALKIQKFSVSLSLTGSVARPARPTANRIHGVGTWNGSFHLIYAAVRGPKPIFDAPPGGLWHRLKRFDSFH